MPTERLDDRGVELGRAVAPQLGEGLLTRARGVVGALGDHRVVGVADGDDARAEWYRLAGEPVRIAGPSQRSWLERTRRATGRSAGAALRMRSPMIVCWRMRRHSLSLSGPGLVEDLVGDGELAEVVKLGRAAKLVELF